MHNCSGDGDLAPGGAPRNPPFPAPPTPPQSPPAGEGVLGGDGAERVGRREGGDPGRAASVLAVAEAAAAAGGTSSAASSSWP